jgi:hypothetical protein
MAGSMNCLTPSSGRRYHTHIMVESDAPSGCIGGGEISRLFGLRQVLCSTVLSVAEERFFTISQNLQNKKLNYD